MNYHFLFFFSIVVTVLLSVGKSRADVPLEPEFEIQSTPELHPENESSAIRTVLAGCALASVVVAAGLLTVNLTSDRATRWLFAGLITVLTGLALAGYWELFQSPDYTSF